LAKPAALSCAVIPVLLQKVRQRGPISPEMRSASRSCKTSFRTRLHKPKSVQEDRSRLKQFLSTGPKKVQYLVDKT
jgi:hypothetical protein